MKQLKLTFLLTMLMSMVGVSVIAHDFEAKNADGVTIYYRKISDTEVAVSYQGNFYNSFSDEYSGNVVIPETLTYNGVTYSVTSIDQYAFYGCPSLTSVTIPKSSYQNTSFSYFFLNNIGKGCHIYIMDGETIWSEIITGAPTNFFTFYDCNGDGIMEYLGYQYDVDSQLYNYGFFDNEGNLKDKRFTSQYTDDSYIATPINGKGDLLIYRTGNYHGTHVDVDGIGSGFRLLADIDNDGRKDLVGKYENNSDNFTINYQQLDGTFLPTEQSVTLDIADIDTKKGTGGVLSFAVGMMVGPGSASYFDNQTSLDMNNDGILDLMDTDKGGVLYSYDDNRFLANPKKGVLYPCDLNGDSELDYVCYDGKVISLLTRTGNSSFNEKTLFSNENVKQVIYKDFDHDGDVDIMAYITGGGSTYFVFFRNDGNLSFKKKERNFTITYTLQEVKDIDADGQYEMLVYDNSNEGAEKAKLLTIGTDFSISEGETDLSDCCTRYYNGNYYAKAVIGDFDNDGKVDYRYAVSDTGVKYGSFSQSVNTAPGKMEAPTALLNAETGRLRINWKQGTDKETSSCDLTYELRIGTQPASGDILFGASLADGTRRTLEEGNMGRSLTTLFNAKSLKPGKYYISVQAIDGGGRGGAWSDDFVYEHQLSVPIIVSNYTHHMSTADTLLLSVKTPIEDANYQWTVSDGKQIENENGYIKYVFEHDGEHIINLSMTIDGRTMNAEPLTLFAEPAKEVPYIGNEPGVVDLNQDGYPEVLGKVNDGTGKFEDVLLSYVTDIPVEADYSGARYADRVRCYMDYNMDGYPDVVVKNNVYINVGEQDNDFEMFNQTFNWGFNPGVSSEQTFLYVDRGYWFDANNDGYLDTSTHYNDGTNIGWEVYHSTEEKAKYYDEESRTYVNKYYNAYYGYLLGSPNYDVNRDGFMDIVKNVGSKWYVMYKDSTVNISYTAPCILFEVDNSISVSDWIIEDVNNDGYVDLILYDNNESEKVIVVKGRAQLPCSETVEYDVRNSSYFRGIRDFNNDGYLDMAFDNIMLSFTSDFTANSSTLSRGIFDDRYGCFMVQKDGGYPDGYDSHITNQPPSAPATVAAKRTNDGLLITWSDAQDDHTPAMQMRYNISVKRKGKNGDNSFVISPMNGLIDKATICGEIMYKKSTQMLVPASVLTAGETYEIQVQAIDLWNQHSPMTKAIEFTMTSDGYIDVAEQVTVGKETIVKFVGSQTSSYTLNAGTDGTIVKDNGNGNYIVKWTSEGVKDITLTAGNKTVKSSVTVIKPVDLTFTVPQQVFADVPLTINVSDEMAAEPKDIGLRCNNNEVKVEYLAGSKTATVTFHQIGTFELEAYCTDAIRGNSYKQIVNVTAEMPKSSIEQVDVDDQTGYYAVKWNASSLPTGIQKVIIRKEGSILNQFNVIDTVAINIGRYIDKSSTPAVMSSRYCIQLLASNGQTSEPSTPHKPLHVMIAKGTKGYNLIWDSYEGINVETYNILHGSSPDNLQQIAQVAGSINSYTDGSASSGVCYYAVTFQASPSASRRAPSEDAISSNVISTKEAIDMVEAQSLEIIIIDEDRTLSASHPDLQLYHMILPTYATISKVKWEIVEGSDIAVIDADGNLHGTGTAGTVKVRVSTIDGSNLSAEIDIAATFAPIPMITADNQTREYGEENPELTYSVTEGELDGEPELTTTATETSPVGTYPIAVSQGTIVGNYYSTDGILTITKSPLTITAKDYTIKQGQALPEFEATYEGFKNNETSEVLTKQPVITTTATSASEPGEYEITVSGAEAQNYEITYVKGKLTITAAFIPGDVNGDGLVNVTDIVATVNFIMEKPSDGFNKAAADLSGDGDINVTDIVKMVSIIMNGNGGSSRRAAATSSKLVINRNNIQLRNAEAYTAAQFDINLSEGQSINNVVLNVSSDHSLYWKMVDANTYRVVVYSMTNAAFRANSDNLFTVFMTGSQNATISNELLIKADGTTGIDAIRTEAENGNVYDLNGRQVKTPRKGVYIINGRKVVVK